MKQIYPILFAILYVGFIGLSIQYTTDSKSQYEIIDYKESKRMRIDKAIEQRYNVIKDENGEVPSNELRQVYDYVKRLDAQGKLRNGNLSYAKWMERGPYQIGGRTRAILLDRNDPERKTVFTAGVSGGLWKSTNILNNPPNWEIVNDYFQNLMICSIVQDPNNPEIIYFGTGEGYFGQNSFRGQGLWKSEDGGDTWNYLPSTSSQEFFFTIKLEIHPLTSDVYAATLGGLMRSSDGGSTWERVLGFNVSGGQNDMTDLEIAPDGTIYASSGHAGSGGRVFKSEGGANAGNIGNWTRLNNFPANRNRIELAVAPSNPTVIYSISTGTGGAIAMHRSGTSGLAWLSIPGPTQIYNEQAWYNLTIEVDPKNENRVVVGVLSNAISVDAGNSWTSITGQTSNNSDVHVDQHAIVYDDLNSDNLYLGNDGGIYISRNATGNSSDIQFLNRNQRYNVTQFYACAMHPEAYKDYFLAGAQDNGSQRFQGFGLVSTTPAFGADGAFCHIDQKNPQNQIVSWQNGNYLFSRNGGESFPGGVTVPAAYFINPSAYDSDSATLYALAGNGGNYQRTKINDSQNSIFVTVDNITDFSAASIFVSENTPNRLYFGMNGGRIGIVDDADDGDNKTATFLLLNSFGTVTCVVEEKGNANHILATVGNYGATSVYESFDAGQTWVSVEGDLPDMPVNWVIFDPTNSDRAFLATEAGVWTTENLNGGNTAWLPSMNGVPLVRVDMLQIRESDNLILAGTHGRGLFTTDCHAPANARFEVEQVGYLETNRQFFNTSYNTTTTDWIFGDGGTSTDFSPIHQYQAIGIYSASLTVNSNITTDTDIKILPDRTIPYTEEAAVYGGDFESLEEDFGIYTLSGSAWEKGNSTVAGKEGVKSGSNAWVIGLTDDFYEHNTETYLYTPNYDFSEAAIYEMSFWANHNTQYGWDGLQIQYSIDRGESWEVLGEEKDNWYNFTADDNRTPFAQGSGVITGESFGYIQYKYNMQEVEGFENVAFRFAFITNESGRQQGVAIDDFKIRKYTEQLETVLLDFDAEFADNNKANVTWSTQPEYRCKKFELELSENGKDYIFYGEIAAQGSTIDLTNYVNKPGNLTKDLYYFRLKVILEDETFFYSNIEVIQRFDTPLDFQNIYPNPFTDYLDIAFNDFIKGEATFSMYDATGKKLLNNTVTLNDVFYRLELPYLPKGVYFLSVQIGETTLTKKLMK